MRRLDAGPVQLDKADTRQLLYKEFDAKHMIQVCVRVCVCVHTWSRCVCGWGGCMHEPGVCVCAFMIPSVCGGGVVLVCGWWWWWCVWGCVHVCGALMIQVCVGGSHSLTGLQGGA